MGFRKNLRRTVERLDIDPEPVGGSPRRSEPESDSAPDSSSESGSESGSDRGPEADLDAVPLSERREGSSTERSISVAGVPVEFRLIALSGIGVLTLSYLSVLYDITDVVGASTTMAVLVVGTVAAATLLARHLRPRDALGTAVLLLAIGGGGYFLSIPSEQLALVSVETVVVDGIALLTGLSVLRLLAVHVWVLGITPAPLFLSWYLAVRGRYAASAFVGSLVLGLVVLTGDAGTTVTLLGALGALTALGFGTLNRHGATSAQFDAMAVTMAAIVVLSTTVAVVPGGAGGLGPVGDGEPETVESNVVSDDGRVPIVGSIDLSPEVRFSVESSDPAYWRTGSYDRYTGDQWLRTGESSAYEGGLTGPPGDDRTIRQTVTAETPLGVMPAAWRPVAVDDETAPITQVTDQGALQPAETIDAGESYSVESHAPVYSEQDLRDAGTAYPANVEERYTQLPDSTPERVARQAESVAGDEPTPYDKAVAIDRYLQTNKGYSLDVERPDGDVADAFLFEMEAGYCTYFATTMVTMLRTQDVPARFVTGYTTGEQVGDDEYVTRGLNAHAWVEVYFPETGWVAFDPTPSGPREDVRDDAIQEARQAGVDGVDTNATEPDDPNGIEDGPEELPDEENVTDPDDADPAFDDEEPAPIDSEGEEGTGIPLPSRRVLGIGAVGLVGLAAGARRAGLVHQVRGRFGLYYQSRSDDPETDVHRAHERVERLLAHDFRPRRPHETPREYLNSIPEPDERVLTVGRLYEQARYGDGVTSAEAQTAVECANALARGRLPWIGRLWE